MSIPVPEEAAARVGPAVDRRAFALSIAITIAAGATLFVMGRAVWCGCGSPVPWSFEVWSRHNSQHLIDAYGPTHVLHGVVFYGLLRLAAKRMPTEWRFSLAVLMESAWEILENSPIIIERYRAATMSLDYYGDSVLNSVSDVAACALGFWMASRLRPRLSIAFFLLVELALVFWIRDSLTLNVIMLVYPIDAIRAWQTE